MNKLFKGIVFLFWAVILYVCFRYQLYIDSTGKITGFIQVYPEYSTLIFLIIALFRTFTLIPCTVFIIIAGILFNPVKAFILVTIANLLSEILLFLFVKLTIGMGYQEKIINKYPKVYRLIQNNNIKILALGVSSPVVPSDIICFFSTLTGITFSKYVLTIFIADTPIIISVSYMNYRKWNSQVNL